MHYVISRGTNDGRKLTPAQRCSSLFAEEPVVLGKVLRRGSRPMTISEQAYEANKDNLLRLARAGSIHIVKVLDDKPNLTAEEFWKLMDAGPTRFEQVADRIYITTERGEKYVANKSDIEKTERYRQHIEKSKESSEQTKDQPVKTEGVQHTIAEQVTVGDVKVENLEPSPTMGEPTTKKRSRKA